MIEFCLVAVVLLVAFAVQLTYWHVKDRALHLIAVEAFLRRLDDLSRKRQIDEWMRQDEERGRAARERGVGLFDRETLIEVHRDPRCTSLGGYS